METLLGGCCGRNTNYDLNRRESRNYNKFQSTMIVEYDRTNEEHEHNLALLYKKAFKTMELKSNPH